MAVSEVSMDLLRWWVLLFPKDLVTMQCTEKEKKRYFHTIYYAHSISIKERMTDIQISVFACMPHIFIKAC